MSHTFNLIDQQWIPCITQDGKLIEVGLYDLLAESHQLRQVYCETPLMTASIFPVALAILYRVFRVNGIDDWEKLWLKGAFDAQTLENYFSQWYDRFDLFHPDRPFYQTKDERVKPKSLIHLVHSIGNTATLFTHENEEMGITLSPAEAARHLLTGQYFRIAGLSGLDEKFTDSILTRGVLFLAEGETLFQMLMLNLVAYPNIMPNTPYDAPSWEAENPFEKRSVPKGYLDFLTWQSNRVLLLPEEENGKVVVKEMTIAPALSLSAEVINPFKRYRRIEKKGEVSWIFLYFDTHKALWRDYHSLFILHTQDVRPPAVVDWLSRLSRYVSHIPLKLMAIGMLIVNSGKPIFYRQEHLSLPTILLDEEQSETLALIEQAVFLAEEMAEILRGAVFLLAKEVIKRGSESEPDKDNVAKLADQWDVVQSFYWQQLENEFWAFVEAVSTGNTESAEQWRTILRQVAFNALAQAQQLAGNSPGAWKGEVIAKQFLNVKLKKLFTA